ncbi:macrolide export protein MacA [Geobacter sp. OR-1]|uniref:efflux RND transporter periplasmic adaptor subunit n=1 Tax=Geobacter sp. OR-1 TaxID=1266765 RepID=UPI00054297A2|nr:efflux RND transporter periplasmic adaptor subunit [Geobacter sp. OR-1]GAM09834.1 macrolide export protein MacA [Geobacter sp. OR-1]
MKKVLIISVVIAIIAGISWYLLKGNKPAVTYRTVKIERGTILSTVAATGNLSAVTTVQVGTQVSGTIQKLYVDYNSRVKNGQTIAEIDPSLFNAAVEQARGNALNAEANLQKARVTLADAERTLTRYKKLLSDGIVSQSDYDVAETASQAARASLKAAEGSVAQTKGALLQAKTNLRYSVIRSPVDGVVISRAVDVGQTVAASFQTPTLFTIAQDLTKMQIETSVDEADISRVSVGQKASFTVDAYPELTFGGKVVQVRSAPVVNQNVVTYVVVVNVDNKELKLKPGMTANVNIEVGRKENVLKLPPAALRFKPKAKTDEARAKKGNGSPQGGKPGKKDKGQQVYVLKDNNPVPVSIKTGIGNDSSIELLEGALKEGDEVVVEQMGGDTKKKAGSAMGGSPMGPRPH